MRSPFACLSVLLLVLGTTGAPAVAQQQANVVPNRYIVQFEDFVGDPAGAALAVAAAHRGQALAVYRRGFRGAGLVVPPAVDIEELRTDPRVRAVEPDRFVRIPTPRDDVGRAAKPPWAGGGDKNKDAGQVIPTGIRRIGADLNGNEGLPDIVVAVLDTGIDLDHPDLADNIFYAVDVTTDGTGGDDNNKSRGVKGHGTHVAGVIAALNNDIAVRGVGPGLGLASIKVLDRNGAGTLLDILVGLDIVAQFPQDFSVVNMSFGGRFESLLFEAMCEAVATFGVTLVAAAGNDGLDVYGDGNPATPADNFVPAAYPTVISVSALDDRDGTDADDFFASFSNHGAGVDLIGPGVSILSTSNDGDVSSLSGTSFASPHVAGVAGLYLTTQPRYPNRPAPTQVRQVLIDSGLAPPLGVWPGDPDGIDEPLVNGNAPEVGGTGS